MGQIHITVLVTAIFQDIEMAGMFKDIKRDKLIFVFSPCNSGGFIDDLSGEKYL